MRRNQRTGVRGVADLRSYCVMVRNEPYCISSGSSCIHFSRNPSRLATRSAVQSSRESRQPTGALQHGTVRLCSCGTRSQRTHFSRKHESRAAAPIELVSLPASCCCPRVSHLGITATATDETRHVETTPFDTLRPIGLRDNHGRLRASYATIQAAVSAAVNGDEVLVPPGIYREDVYVDHSITLSRDTMGLASERMRFKVHIVGRVVVAASAMKVQFHGIAIDGGPLELDSSIPAPHRAA